MSRTGPERNIGQVTRSGTRNAQTSRARLTVEKTLEAAQEPLSPVAIANRTEPPVDLPQVRRILQALRVDGYIVNVGTANAPRYRHRNAGKTPSTRSSEPRTSGRYDGSELKPFSGRPGAMDAFACPSLSGGKLTPYRGPRPQCVGPERAEGFSYSRKVQE